VAGIDEVLAAVGDVLRTAITAPRESCVMAPMKLAARDLGKPHEPPA